MDEAQLRDALATIAEIECTVRKHLIVTRDRAGEQVRGQTAYRHAVALRRSLEDWIETRNFRAQ